MDKETLYMMYEVLIAKQQNYIYSNISSGQMQKAACAMSDVCGDTKPTLEVLEDLINDGYSENVTEAINKTIEELKIEKILSKYIGIPVSIVLTGLVGAAITEALPELINESLSYFIVKSLCGSVLIGFAGLSGFLAYKLNKKSDEYTKIYQDFAQKHKK